MFHKQCVVNQVDGLVRRQANVKCFSLFEGDFLGFGSGVLFVQEKSLGFERVVDGVDSVFRFGVAGLNGLDTEGDVVADGLWEVCVGFCCRCFERVMILLEAECQSEFCVCFNAAMYLIPLHLPRHPAPRHCCAPPLALRRRSGAQASLRSCKVRD